MSSLMVSLISSFSMSTDSKDCEHFESALEHSDTSYESAERTSKLYEQLISFYNKLLLFYLLIEEGSCL